MMLLAKSSDSYWVFWVDYAFNNSCCIGRLPITMVDNDETIDLVFMNTVKSVTDLYLIVSNPKGYIKL